MLHRLALALGLTLTPVMALAAGDVVEFFLDNGMQVVVIADDRAPAVTHMVWYRVGAADEPGGRRARADRLSGQRDTQPEDI